MAVEKGENATQKASEPDTFLTSIDAQIAALQHLRASYVAAKAVGAFGGGGDLGAPGGGLGSNGASSMGGGPIELPRGALLGKSLPAAIRLYLSAVKRKVTSREIVSALREHGVESTAKNFETPVGSALYRMRDTGEVLRFKDGWSLAEFYPENLRRNLTEKGTTKSAKKAKKRQKSKNAATAKTKATASKAPEVSPAEKNPDVAIRIEAFLRQQTKPVPPSVVAQALGVPANIVGLALGRLKKAQRVTKADDGAYSVVAA